MPEPASGQLTPLGCPPSLLKVFLLTAITATQCQQPRPPAYVRVCVTCAIATSPPEKSTPRQRHVHGVPHLLRDLVALPLWQAVGRPGPHPAARLAWLGEGPQNGPALRQQELVRRQPALVDHTEDEVSPSCDRWQSVSSHVMGRPVLRVLIQDADKASSILRKVTQRSSCIVSTFIELVEVPREEFQLASIQRAHPLTIEVVHDPGLVQGLLGEGAKPRAFAEGFASVGSPCKLVLQDPIAIRIFLMHFEERVPGYVALPLELLLKC